MRGPNQKLEVVLRDPIDEQEARFDQYRSAALIALRFRGKELLYAQDPGSGAEGRNPLSS